MVVKKVQLTQGKFALVDDEDYEKINRFKWHYAAGYARRNVRLNNGKRKIIFMHRIIAETPDGLYCDHINGDTLDNRKSNLRNVTKQQNNWNAKKKTKATSKYKGVYFFKRDKDQIGKWGARIQVDGKLIRLGYFSSEIEAALAYNRAAKKYFGEYAVLNEVVLMNFYEYQKLAERTIPKEKWFNTKVSNFSMGLAGESGEIIDYLKKVIYHGHELDREHMKEELGDLLWYVSGLASIMNLDLNEIAKENIEKLKKRYPNGFSETDSRNRVV